MTSAEYIARLAEIDRIPCSQCRAKARALLAHSVAKSEEQA